MPKKPFLQLVRDGISFASQKRFLAVQVGYYLSLIVVALLLLAVFAAGLLSAFALGGIGSSIASAEKMLLRLGILAFALAVVMWLSAKWLSIYFIFSAKSFLQKERGDTKRAAMHSASKRFLPFAFASLFMGFVFLLGTVFFILLGKDTALENVASALSSIYAMFFTLAFLFAPFHLSLGGKEVWPSLSDSFNSFAQNPVRTFLLMVAAEITEVVSLVVSAIPLVLAALAFLWAISSGAGLLSLFLAGVLLLIGLVLFVAGISFANLAAIGMYCSAFLQLPAQKERKK